MLKRSQRHKISNLINIFSVKNNENNSQSSYNSQHNNFSIASPSDDNYQRESSPADQIVGINSQAANDSIGGQANNHDITEEVNLNLNILSGIPLRTPLIDIPFSQMGCLIGISNSATFIPDNLANYVRQVFIKYLRELDSSIGTPALKWKRYFLLPTIIFSCSYRDGGKLKEEMKKKLDLLSRNLWDIYIKVFVIESDSSRRSYNKLSRAEKLIKAGQLSRAYKAIEGDKNRLTPCDDVFNPLSEKYLAEGINRLTDDQMNELNAFRFNENVQRRCFS